MDPMEYLPFPPTPTNAAFLELSISPDKNAHLIPPHARPALEARGLGLDTFKPLSKEEMIAHLD